MEHSDPLGFSLDFDLGASATVPSTRKVKPVYPPRKLLKQIPGTDDYVLHIDNSSLERFTTCSRAAEYYLGFSRESASLRPALGFGKAIHSALELRGLVDNLSTPGVLAAVEQRQIEILVEHFEQHPVPPTEFRTCEFAIQVIQKYNKKFPAELFTFFKDPNGSPYVEVPFTVPLGALEINAEIPYLKSQVVENATDAVSFHIANLHIVWTGRIDAMIELQDQLWIMDHKTSSMMGATFYDDFYLSNAMIGYAWAAQKITGRQVHGLLLNAIGIRQPTAKGTGVPIEFERQRYLYSQDKMEEWELNTRFLVSDFVSHLVRGYFPMETKWCMGKYGKCEFWDTCNLPQKQRLTDLHGSTYHYVTWSPLNE